MQIPDITSKGNFRVVLTDLALMHLLHAALEAFVVPHATSEGTGAPSAYVETFGLLWGRKRWLETRHGPRIRLITVESAAPDTSAKRDRGSCEPSPEALALKRDVNSSLWPERELVGNYHSHPYDRTEAGHQTIEAENRFLPSDGDQAWAASHRSEWQRIGVECSLVVTISKMARARQPGGNLKHPPAVEVFNLGNLRIWVAALKVRQPIVKPGGGLTKIPKNETLTTKGVQLILPKLSMHTEFGRHKGDTFTPGDLGTSDA